MPGSLCNLPSLTLPPFSIPAFSLFLPSIPVIIPAFTMACPLD